MFFFGAKFCSHFFQMQLQSGKTLKLEDIAEELFESRHYEHLVLTGTRYEGCDNFETLRYFKDLSNFTNTLGPIFNVRSISPSCVSFSLGTPNPQILKEYQQIYQDSKIVKIHGYDSQLWDILDVVYKNERSWRLEDIPICCRDPHRIAKEPYVLDRGSF